MDRWAHADEEFRLKRLELDIDRASWLVEMLLEWSEEKDGAVRREIVEALARGLFQVQGSVRPTLHPVKSFLLPSCRLRHPTSGCSWHWGSDS